MGGGGQHWKDSGRVDGRTTEGIFPGVLGKFTWGADEAKRKADEPEVLDEDDNAMDDATPTVPGPWGLNDKSNPAAHKYSKKTFLNCH